MLKSVILLLGSVVGASTVIVAGAGIATRYSRRARGFMFGSETASNR